MDTEKQFVQLGQGPLKVSISCNIPIIVKMIFEGVNRFICMAASFLNQACSCCLRAWFLGSRVGVCVHASACVHVCLSVCPPRWHQ